FLPIDGCEIGFHPARDHRVRQRQGRPQPQRKQRCDAGAVELLLAVGLDILKEQIAEDDVGDALADGAGHGFAHSRLVDRVWAGIGYRHDARRQSRCIQLRPQNLLPHAVDRYPVERLGHRRQRADNVEFTRAPDLMERERAVLSARPRDQCLRPRLFQLIGAPTVRRRRFGTRAGDTAGSVSLSAPILRSAASAARSPLSQAPSTVPHSVSWVASPARKSAPSGSVKIFRDGWPPGEAADIAPSTKGEAFQRVALVFCTAAAASLPNSLVIHSLAKAIIAFSPWAERSRPNEPPTSIEHSEEPPILANSNAVRVELL